MGYISLMLGSLVSVLITSYDYTRNHSFTIKFVALIFPLKSIKLNHFAMKLFKKQTKTDQITIQSVSFVDRCFSWAIKNFQGVK